MSRRAQQSTGGLLDRIPIGRAAGLGAAAYVAVFVVTYVFLELQDDTDFSGSDVSQFDVAGWFFYSSHFADIQLTRNGETSSENVVSSATDLTVPEPIWYLVPVVVLLAAGFVVAKGVDSRSASDQDIALSGAGVVAGYLPLAVVGTFLFKYETEQSILGQTISTSIAPDTVMSVGLAGVAYPVVLGAVGAYLTTVVGDSGASQPRGGRRQTGQRRQGGTQRGQQRGQRGQRGQQRQAAQQRGQQAQRGGQQQGGNQRGGQQRGGRQRGDRQGGQRDDQR